MPPNSGTSESGNARRQVQGKRSRGRGNKARRQARQEQRQRQALEALREAVDTANLRLDLLHDKAKERQDKRVRDEDRKAKAWAIKRLTTDLETLYEEHRSLRPAPTPDRVHAPAEMVGDHGKPRAVKKRDWTDFQVTENEIAISSMEDKS